ncbi:MAG: hypothetical protein JWM15_3912, partial [Cryptosporangiaceae bacterium]|nr:hypothetical protein [Cryptosporangiaceae bacterium]
MPQQPQEATPDVDIEVRAAADPGSPFAEQPHDDTLAALAGDESPTPYEPESGPPREAGPVTDARRAVDTEPAVTERAVERRPEDPPAQDAPAQDAPTDGAPAEDTRTDNTPAEDTRTEDPVPRAEERPQDDARGAALQADTLAAGRRAAVQA